MTDPSRLAATLLRLSLGGLFLAHAGLKLFVFTPSGTARFFASLGLPGPLAYLTIAAEVVGGLALIAGLYTRAAAIALMPVLLGAIFTVHGSKGFFFNSPGGGWEFPAFWLATLAVQVLLGDGAFAAGRRSGTVGSLHHPRCRITGGFRCSRRSSSVTVHRPCPWWRHRPPPSCTDWASASAVRGPSLSPRRTG